MNSHTWLRAVPPTTRAGPRLRAGFTEVPLTVVHLVGIPVTGTSVNPARSLGPALVVGGTALSQVWLFIVAPLVGGVLAAVLHRSLYREEGIKLAAEAQQPDETGAAAPS